MGAVILVSGPVGAGKTEVSRALVRQEPEGVAHIEGDDFWKFMPEVGKGETPRDQVPILIRSTIAASIPLARSGFKVLVDFTIPPQALVTARKIVKELRLHWVVIRPSLEVCESRATARAPGKQFDYTPYRSLYELFAEVPDEHLFAGDELAIEDIAVQVRKRIDRDITRID